MRFATIGALALLAASAAQAQEERPQGWMTRFDREGVTEANLERFVSMPPGWHISTGRGAGIFYDLSMTARSEYTLTSTVFSSIPAGGIVKPTEFSSTGEICRAAARRTPIS